MKTRLLILLLCLSSLSVMGQGIITRNKPKQEQAAQKKEQSKPVAKKETPAKKTNSGNGASSRSGKQPATRSSVTVSEGTRYGDHYYVDLGLPSGTKWATTNVGATSPSDYGNYYAWGETKPKRSYDYENMKYNEDTKYGKIDGKTELDQNDDAACVNWGNGWRTPSYEQVMELIKMCTWVQETIGGRYGYKVVGSNGNSIFLPATGYRYGNVRGLAGACGNYWSRTVNPNASNNVWSFGFCDGGPNHPSGGLRSEGLCVRPVLEL